MEPFVHEDVEGDVLMIAPRSGKTATALVKALNGAEVRAAEMPVIVGKLYEACGLPSPVILERPEVSIPQAGDGDALPAITRHGNFGFRLYGRAVAVSLPGVEVQAVSAAELREAAAFMAAYADAVEAEPDAEEVDELAHAIPPRAFPRLRPGRAAAERQRPASRTRRPPLDGRQGEAR